MQSNGSLHILIVEGHEIFRRALQRLIESEISGCECSEASSGAEARHIMKGAKPDLVILELGLGLAVSRQGDIDAFAEMVREFPQIKAIILGTHADPRQIEEALKIGAKGYLLRESSVEELFSGIAAVMQGKTYLCPAVAEIVVRNHVRQGGAEVTYDDNPASQLSAREQEVLKLLSEGCTSKEIATRLFVGVKTVESHRSQLMSKLNIRSIAGLTKYAVRAGLTSL